MPSPRSKRQQQQRAAARERRRGFHSSRAKQPSPTGPSEDAVVGASSLSPAFPSSPPRHHNKSRRVSLQSDGSPTYSPTLCEQKVEIRRRSSLMSLGNTANNGDLFPSPLPYRQRMVIGDEDDIPCDNVDDEIMSTVSTKSSDGNEASILESCGRGSMTGFGSRIATGFRRFSSTMHTTGASSAAGTSALPPHHQRTDGDGCRPPPDSGATSRTHSTVLSVGGAPTPRRVSFSSMCDETLLMSVVDDNNEDYDGPLTRTTSRTSKLTADILATLSGASHQANTTRRRSSLTEAARERLSSRAGGNRRPSSFGQELEGNDGATNRPSVTRGGASPQRQQYRDDGERLPFQLVSPRRVSSQFVSTSAAFSPSTVSPRKLKTTASSPLLRSRATNQKKPPLSGGPPSVRSKPTLAQGYSTGFERRSSHHKVIDCPSGRFSGGQKEAVTPLQQDGGGRENMLPPPPHSGRAMMNVFI